MTPVTESDRTVAALDTILKNYPYVTIRSDGDLFKVLVGTSVYKTEIEVSDKSMSNAVLVAARKAIE